MKGDDNNRKKRKKNYTNELAIIRSQKQNIFSLCQGGEKVSGKILLIKIIFLLLLQYLMT